MRALIIPASGFSQRMGEKKLLLPLWGKRMIEHVINSCRDLDFDKKIIVTNDNDIKEIGVKENFEILSCPEAAKGQSQSIIKAISHITDSYHMFFINGDQPYITREIILEIIEESKKFKDSIIIPFSKGRRGAPTVFPPMMRKELMQIRGDQGGKQLLEQFKHIVKYVEIKDNIFFFDIDTPEDYKFALENPRDNLS